MNSNRARKDGGGSRDLRAGLKYSSRPEVGEGRALGVRRRGPGSRPEWPGAGRCERAPRAPGAAAPRFVLAKGTAPLPICGPGAGRPDRWNFLFGRCLADLWYQPCRAPAGHGGGGNPKVLGDAESLPRPSRPLSPFPDPKKGLHLGSSINSALLVHVWKEPGVEARSGVVWAEEGRFPGGFEARAILRLCGSLLFSFPVRRH